MLVPKSLLDLTPAYLLSFTLSLPAHYQVATVPPFSYKDFTENIVNAITNFCNTDYIVKNTGLFFHQVINHTTKL